jgi:hypothetical protein
METSIPIEWLTVCGYSDVLPDWKGPVIVPPIFLLKDGHYLVPPFQIEKTSITHTIPPGLAYIPRWEYEQLTWRGEITTLSQQFSARCDHILWVDTAGFVKYEPSEQVKKALQKIEYEHLYKSVQKFDIWDFDEAEKLAWIALAAWEKSILPRILLAACARAKNEEWIYSIIRWGAIKAFDITIDAFDKRVSTILRRIYN